MKRTNKKDGKGVAGTLEDDYNEAGAQHSGKLRPLELLSARVPRSSIQDSFRCVACTQGVFTVRELGSSDFVIQDYSALTSSAMFVFGSCVWPFCSI